MSKAEILRELRRRIRKLPKGVEPLYRIAPPNPPMVVYRGRIFARPGQLQIRDARLEYCWDLSPRLRVIGALHGLHEPFPRGLQIRAPKSGVWLNISVTQVNIGKRSRVEGIFHACLRIGPNRPVRAVLFHVPNFHSYVGSQVRFGSLASLTVASSRLELSAGEWVARIDQLPDLQLVPERSTVKRGYRVEHAALLCHRSGRPFRVQEISDFWSALHFFLTFARGNWCGPTMPVGMGRRGPIWSEWCSWRVAPFKDVPSWFPRLAAPQVQQAFLGFHSLWQTATWNEPLRELVHWYAEANLNAGALEGSIILAHTALELLAWMHVVVDRQTYTAKTFEGEHSDERIRIALSSLRVPTLLPPCLPAAQQLAAAERIQDAPELVNRLRNALVHPTPRKRRFLARASHLARIETLQLALYCLELGILSLCGYRGQYVSRLVHGAYVGEATDKVPWA